MPLSRVTGTPRRALGVALVLLFVLPAFSGCLAALKDDPVGVKTSCPGAGGPPPQALEVTHPYAKAKPHSEARIPPQSESVRVVALLPDGPVSDAERGLDLAVSELREVGAEIDLVKAHVSAGDGVAVRAAFNESTRDEKPAAVISGLGDDGTRALVWLARDRGVPLVAAVADAARTTAFESPGGYFFRVTWTDATEGRAAAELLWASGCRSANVIVEPGTRSADVANAFRSAFMAKGGEVARVVTLQDDAKNAGAALDRVELLVAGDKDDAPRPDAILVIASPEDAASVLRQAYVKKITARSAFFFTEATMDDAFVTTAGKDANGHLIAVGLRGTSAMAAETRATQAFERAYHAATGLPATNASARAYDALYVTILAAACARDDDPRSVLPRLAEVNNRDSGDTDVSGADPLFAITTATARCGVNYVGASGDYDWDREGEPVTGRYFFWAVSGEGTIRVTHSRVEPPAR